MDNSEPIKNDNIEQKKLTDIEITNEDIAVNVLVSFCNVANHRGCFSIVESGKIWECIKLLSDKKKKITG